MALTSTLFTGLSGLNVNQTRLNVVGNNIANVNTVAFKASRALFKPQFYVTDSGGTPADDTFGGSNPSQRVSARSSRRSKKTSPRARSNRRASRRTSPSRATGSLSCRARTRSHARTGRST
jgi:flagellar basal body rod protein FlgG